MTRMTDCWVISTKTNKAWLIDTDETKPVYLKDGLPHYQDGELFNYRLSNTPPEGTAKPGEWQDADPNAPLYQTNIFDFMEVNDEQ